MAFNAIAVGRDGGQGGGMTIDWDALEKAGVYDPRSDQSGERRDLLEYFASIGVPTDAILECGVDKLITVGVDHVASQVHALTAIEVAERAEFPLRVVEELYSVLGVPIVDVTQSNFTDADVKFLRGIAEGPAAMFQVSEMAEMLRVFGNALARIADAGVATFMHGVERRLVDVGASEVEMAKAQVAALDQAAALGPLLSVILRHHFRSSIGRLRDASIAAGGEGVRIAVGFVDVVGFTPLSASLTPTDLGELVAKFENRTSDVISRCGGTVVKHIGDEVMFMAVDPNVACEIVLALVDDFAAQGVQPHAGLTFGNAVTRRGDYYGPQVNLASRLVNHAVPGEILVNSEMEAAAIDESRFEFVPAGRRMVRGFEAPVPVWTLERTAGARRGCQPIT